MKYPLFVFLFVWLLADAYPVSAQIPDTLIRQKSNLVDSSGNILSDAEILDLIGEQIYNETYISARKQYKDGHFLLWFSAAGLAVGLPAMMGGGFHLMQGLVEPFLPQKNEEERPQNSDYSVPMYVSLICYGGGAILSSFSLIALNVGIPLSIIGKKRLDWVVDDYNAGSSIAYYVGPTPNGVGLVLRF
jgi:hypothetical protein